MAEPGRSDRDRYARRPVPASPRARLAAGAVVGIPVAGWAVPSLVD